MGEKISISQVFGSATYLGTGHTLSTAVCRSELLNWYVMPVFSLRYAGDLRVRSAISGLSLDSIQGIHQAQVTSLRTVFKLWARENKD